MREQRSCILQCLKSARISAIPLQLKRPRSVATPATGRDAGLSVDRSCSAELKNIDGKMRLLVATAIFVAEDSKRYGGKIVMPHCQYPAIASAGAVSDINLLEKKLPM